MSNQVLLTVDGRQYRVSNPADKRPEVQAWIYSKTLGWHWRRFPGNGQRWHQIIALARGKVP